MGGAIFHWIAAKMPGISLKLRQAGIPDRPEEFVKKSFFSSFLMTAGVALLIFTILSAFKILKGFVYLIFPLLFIFMFIYFLRLPDVLVLKKQREIGREIIFAGRFLIIELQSGVPLYNAMSNVSHSYEIIGKYFKEIIDRVDMGTPIEDAINETVETTPSPVFRKVLWQILNSLKTGADISQSLSAVVEQITKEQIIEIREYGRKLTPFAMFYMIMAVILPSIGVIMLIVVATFISIRFDLSVLLVFAGFIGFMQFLFYSMIKSQRPMVEL